jgi:hypothetical protein
MKSVENSFFVEILYYFKSASIKFCKRILFRKATLNRENLKHHFVFRQMFILKKLFFSPSLQREKFKKVQSKTFSEFTLPLNCGPKLFFAILKTFFNKKKKFKKSN